MKLFARILGTPVMSITRAACVLALAALSLMSYSVLDPRAIPVIAAMSVGHALGVSAFIAYLLAIVVDMRSRGRADSAPEPNTTESVPEQEQITIGAAK
ncbi:MAG: hypothetical protein ABUL62_14655 [Myxococcales bacterium]|jgi:hypothetical protein